MSNKKIMAEDQNQPERVWDEYEWERFLQQQDRQADLYLELLERFSDHPERDAMVAQEMGWLHFSGEEAKAWLENLEATEEEELTGHDDEETAAGKEGLEAHPLYARVLELTVWLDALFARKGEDFCLHPAALQLSDQLCILGAKLAAALADDADGELGMTIAYLKRALRSANLGLEAGVVLHRERLLGRVRSEHLRRTLFEVRDGVIELIGGARTEWRRRYGA